MKWPLYPISELLRGPWPQISFVRHGYGYHQWAHDMYDKNPNTFRSPRDVLGIDLPNHLIPLTPLGIYQANWTNSAWDAPPPDVVYVSQLLRAQQTAQHVFPEIPMRVDPRLNEKDVGVAHLRSTAELAEYFPLHMQRYQIDGKYFAAKSPGGENYPDLYVRVHSLLSSIRRDCPGQNVAVVCHSAVMTIARNLFERLPPVELLEISRREWVENCGILRYNWPSRFFGWQNGKFRLALQRRPYHLWPVPGAELAGHFAKATERGIKELREQYANLAIAAA